MKILSVRDSLIFVGHFADTTELKNIDTTDSTQYPSYCYAMVNNIGQYYLDRNSTETDSDDVVNPINGSGAWILSGGYHDNNIFKVLYDISITSFMISNSNFIWDNVSKALKVNKIQISDGDGLADWKDAIIGTGNNLTIGSNTWNYVSLNANSIFTTGLNGNTTLPIITLNRRIDNTLITKSGNVSDFVAGSIFASTSGTSQYNVLLIKPTINQTSVANGTVRGIYYNPTITNILGNHYAFESSTGNVKIGGTNSKLEINDLYILDSDGVTYKKAIAGDVTTDRLEVGAGFSRIRCMTATELLGAVNISGNVAFITGGIIDSASTGSINLRTYPNQLGASIILNTNNDITLTSGSKSIVNVGQIRSFAPVSGNAELNYIIFSGTINQTGTATGTVRGIYYNPTVTSILGTHYAFESTNGDMLVGGNGRYMLNDNGTKRSVLSVINSGELEIGSTSGFSDLRMNIPITTFTNSSGTIRTLSGNLNLTSSNSLTLNVGSVNTIGFTFNSTSVASMSNQLLTMSNNLLLNRNETPSSGSGDYTNILIGSTMSGSGAFSGTMTGLRVSPLFSGSTGTRYIIDFGTNTANGGSRTTHTSYFNIDNNGVSTFNGASKFFNSVNITNGSLSLVNSGPSMASFASNQSSSGSYISIINIATAGINNSAALNLYVRNSNDLNLLSTQIWSRLSNISVGSEASEVNFKVYGNGVSTDLVKITGTGSATQWIFAGPILSLNNTNGSIGFTGSGGSSLYYSNLSANFTFSAPGGSFAQQAAFFFNTLSTQTYATTDTSLVKWNQTFAPTTGTGVYTSIDIAPTYNQTSTATGSIVGIRYRPTVTNVLGTHNAWESTMGNIVIGGNSSTVLQFHNNGSTPLTALSSTTSSVLTIGGGFNTLSVPSMITRSGAISIITGGDLNIQPPSAQGLVVSKASNSSLGDLYSIKIIGNVGSVGSANYVGYSALNTINAPSQTGYISMFEANPTITSINNVLYGFRSRLSSSGFTGAGSTWNIFVDGTAPSYFGSVTTFGNTIVVNTLAGSGNRIVQADSTGVLSSTMEIGDLFITNGTVKTNLENPSNWTSKVYTGTTITGTYQGQYHYDSDYVYFFTSDNVPVRLSKV